MSDTYTKELWSIEAAGGWFAPKGSFVAGGALTSVFTGKPVNDIDLYFKSKEDFEAACKRAYEESFWCADVTSRAVTFKHNEDTIQLMHFDWFETAQEIFDCFDFTCCMGAYDFDGKEFVFDDRFLKHASQRHLEFHHGTRFPFASLTRVLKYQSRGYTIGKGALLSIALRCHETEISCWSDLQEQFGGIYGEQVEIATEQPFSIDAAIKALSADFIKSPALQKDTPLNASQLLQKIGQLTADKP